MSIYPRGFLWGSATSSHQVEGNTNNDWTVWEKTIADLYSKTPHYSYNPKYVSSYIKTEKTKKDNFLSGKASDHYNLYKKDIDLLKSLGQNSYRFSIEWSRVQPKEGEFNEEALKHYRDVITYCKGNNIEPIVTLWHFTNPVWIAQIGGWENTQTVDYFLKYAKKVVEYLGTEVKYWITINEPEVYSADCYLAGNKLVQKKNFYSYNKVLFNLLKAHKASYLLIKHLDNNSLVSIAKHFTYFHLRDPLNYTDRVIKRGLDWFQNYRILNSIENYCDFLGINFYFTIEIGSPKKVSNYISIGPRVFLDNTSRYSDLGWPLFPENIYKVLINLKRYNKPILIAENGLADVEDKHRKWFLQKTFISLEKSIEAGVNLIGYIHWSLLDNFEWSDGFGPRFGLIEVNYKTQERRIRPSAYYYSKYIKDNITI